MPGSRTRARSPKLPRARRRKRQAGGRSARVVVDVAWRVRTGWRAAALLGRVAQRVAAAEGFHCGQLSIAVVGGRLMSTLHRRYLQRAGPTDVLSFDFGSDRACGYLDAEIVVCADLARERTVHCRAALAAARAELALYVVHGILHLAGYDDHTPSTARRMHARERALLPELCVLVR